MSDNEIENYHCGNCKYFHNCKRIDHTTIKFATPWFKSYDQNQFNGCICSSFEPSNSCVYACQTWTGFDNYWPQYVEQWLPYKDTNKLVYFTLHNDTSVRYGVPLMDFVNGTMIKNGILKAVQKMYYKRTKDEFGYKLAREPIDGVRINENNEGCVY